MKARFIVLVLAVAVALAAAGGSTAASGTSSPGATAMGTLSSQPTLGATTSAPDASGDYAVSTVSLDSAASTATVLSDGYLCGNVQYRATQRWYSPIGITLWTYRSTFGVHVCHNSVGYLVALYDEAMDSTLGWVWCGNIARTWTNVTTSAHSYTKGCFDVAGKILDARYPWAKMTIGGNGNLWARSTGVG